MDTLPSGVLLNGGFRSALACIRLSPSCPFRRLHTLRSLRPARLLTPAFGYGAPHLSARGTLTLLNNVLLSTHTESIRQKRQLRPRFHPAFRLLWVLLSRVWTGWESAAELMKPKTVLQYHEHLQVSWAVDFFTVPTGRFQILYIFVILNHSRRQVVQFAVTLHPSGRLIFCSTKRLQKVRTHRDHHWSQQ